MLDSGFYMSLHFSQFIEKGWAFVDSGCYSDGKKGGDGHAIVDAVYSYMTATDTGNRRLQHCYHKHYERAYTV